MIMFFNSKKKIAINAISENVRPLLTLYQHHHGLPSNFWSNEYVIGFFHGMMSIHIKRATASKLNGNDFDFTLIKGYENISGRDGAALWKIGANLSVSRNSEFLAGFDRALMIVLLHDGHLGRELSNSELVLSAMKNSNGNAQAASIEITMITFEEIKAKLSL